MKQIINTLVKYPIIILPIGVFCLIMGVSMCGFYGDCSHTSLAYISERLGLLIIAVCIIATVIRAIYDLARFIRKQVFRS